MSQSLRCRSLNQQGVGTPQVDRAVELNEAIHEHEAAKRCITAWSKDATYQERCFAVRSSPVFHPSADSRNARVRPGSERAGIQYVDTCFRGLHRTVRADELFDSKKARGLQRRSFFKMLSVAPMRGFEVALGQYTR